MRRLPPAQAFGLTRTSVGLTEAHRALIRLLAQKAVSDFLAETDTADIDGSVEDLKEAQS